MRNPTFAEDVFLPTPSPERATAFVHHNGCFEGGPVLAMGVRTMTHNRSGLKLYRTKVVVIEIFDGKERAMFDLDVRMARLYARKLGEYADAIETKKAH